MHPLRSTFSTPSALRLLSDLARRNLAEHILCRTPWCLLKSSLARIFGRPYAPPRPPLVAVICASHRVAIARSAKRVATSLADRPCPACGSESDDGNCAPCSSGVATVVCAIRSNQRGRGNQCSGWPAKNAPVRILVERLHLFARIIGHSRPSYGKPPVLPLNLHDGMAKG